MSTNPIMEWFEYQHLPPALQEASKPLCDLAQLMDQKLPDGPEKSAGLRKLLEAKDCFVRAAKKAMVALLVCVIATGVLSGCATPSEAFVKAERATFTAIAPEYMRYVLADPALSNADKQLRVANLMLWDVGLAEEERNADLPVTPALPELDPKAPEGAGIKDLAGSPEPEQVE